ncbi:MAG: coenzyme F420-0:L-glutamate ligase [Gammaproteobacteria bacterium]|nr:coenzyme F420-0:L-glutamate ligase [Gammaproteobacteria bacterium]
MTFEILPIEGLPLFEEGDDLTSIFLDHLHRSNLELLDGDILAIAQKVISKVEGRLIDLTRVEPSAAATELAEEVEKDPRIVELILQESTDIVRKKTGVLIVRHRLGHVGANAGIDQSNIEHGEEGSALLLPLDPDLSASKIQDEIAKKSGKQIGVLITDSANRPWRLGTVGIAIGASNMMVLDDKRGGFDLHGRELKITMINRADSIAAIATLAMGETDERIPMVIVRGAHVGYIQQSAGEINRPLEDDLFR